MDVETFEAEIARIHEPGDLWALLLRFFEDTPIERIVYHHLPPMGAFDAGTVGVIAAGVPEELVEQYLSERRYRDNPMLRHALGSVEPFYFDDVIEATDLAPSEQALLSLARSIGYRNGLGIQLFGPNGRNGYCGLGFRPGVSRLRPAEVRTYQWVCQLGHLRYCSMLLPGHELSSKLSRRETEVLHWIARGKSNNSVGAILGISAHTVDAHLRRIYVKLGVSDRISAAVRGIGIGLVHAGMG